MRKILLIAALALLAQGCANVGLQNPFETRSVASSEVYYGLFDDVPIPGDMTVDRSRTFITTAPDGARTGLLTAEGRVDIASLTQAMEHNMAGQGWTEIARLSGIKNVNVFEKDSRIAVLYLYDQKFYTAMEVWMTQRLIGFVPNAPAPGTVAPALGYGINATELKQ
jgi:hypothetical protein